MVGPITDCTHLGSMNMKKGMEGRIAMGQATNGIFHVLQVSQIVLKNFQNEMENFPEHSSKIKVFIISIQLVNFLFCMSTTHKCNW